MAQSIVTIRQELAVALGSNYTKYLSVMRDWFANKHNRADWEFDMSFLTGRSRELHNTLIKSILSLCMSSDFDTQRANLEYSAPLVNNNVITLHSAPTQDTISEITPMDIDEVETESVSVSASSPSRDIEEEDEPEENEEMTLKQMFRVVYKQSDPDENEESPTSLLTKVDRRLPSLFVKDFVGINDEFYSVVPNVTHYLSIDRFLRSNPDQGKYFRPRETEKDPWLTTDATIPGKILLRAHERGIESIEASAVKLISKATREHLKDIIRELIKRRKAFKYCSTSGHPIFGEPHVNPYLLTPHVPPPDPEVSRMPYPWILIENDPHTIPPTKKDIARGENDPVQCAAASMERQSRFHSKIGPTELYELIKANPSLFPNQRLRVQLLEKCLQKSKGYFESLVDHGKENDEEEESELLPVCRY